MSNRNLNWKSADLAGKKKSAALRGAELIEARRNAAVFTLPFLTDGLNGKDGLIRGHFASAAKIKDKIAWIFRAQKPQGMKPINHPVKVTYTRYTAHLMDWDNACASFKHIGDALQMAGILADDSPAVIAVFLPVQVKCKMSERRTEILIELI